MPLPATLVVVALLAAGCARRAPDRAVEVTVGLAGSPTAPVHGIDLLLVLPQGATVAHDGPTGRVAASALTLVAEGSAQAKGQFARHRAVPSVRLLVASPTPMAAGPLLRLRAEVPGASAASPGRFETAAVAASGAAGEPVGGVSVSLSATALP